VARAREVERGIALRRDLRQHRIAQLGFNVEETEGVHTSSSLQGVGIEERYRAFMQRMFTLTKEAGGAIRVREFDWARDAICGGPTMGPAGGDGAGFNHQVEPLGIVTMDCDGNLSTFSPELMGQASVKYGNFVFGNVRQNSIGSIRTNPSFRAVQREVRAGVERCRQTCEYFTLCGGGAPANKYFEHGSFHTSETMYCRYSIQVPIDIVLADLESSLPAAAAGRTS